MREPPFTDDLTEEEIYEIWREDIKEKIDRIEKALAKLPFKSEEYSNVIFLPNARLPDGTDPRNKHKLGDNKNV